MSKVTLNFYHAVRVLVHIPGGSEKLYQGTRGPPPMPTMGPQSETVDHG